MKTTGNRIITTYSEVSIYFIAYGQKNGGNQYVSGWNHAVPDHAHNGA